MFSSFFQRRRQREAREANIFRFWDGTRERGIDPIRVLREFACHPTFKIEEHSQATLDGDYEATRILLDAVRGTFGLEPWHEDANGTQHGLTDTEVLELYYRLSEWFADLKKNGSGPQTLPLSTVQEQSA